MVTPVPDFLVAGNARALEQWPHVALRTGVLQCKVRNADQSGETCGVDCSVKHGCCIGSHGVLYTVMRINAAQRFDRRCYEQILLLTPSKRNASPDYAIVKSVIRVFVLGMLECGVDCFESQKEDGEVNWIPFL